MTGTRLLWASIGVWVVFGAVATATALAVNEREANALLVWCFLLAAAGMVSMIWALITIQEEERS